MKNIDFESNQNDTLDIIKKGICIALAIVVLFSSGYLVGGLFNFDIKASLSSEVQSASANATVTNAPLAAPPVVTIVVMSYERDYTVTY